MYLYVREQVQKHSSFSKNSPSRRSIKCYVTFRHSTKVYTVLLQDTESKHAVVYNRDRVKLTVFVIPQQMDRV